MLLFYRTLGVFVDMGRNKAVASILGIPLRGFPAWFAARTYHLAMMPGFARRVRLGAAPLRPSNIRAPGKVANGFAVESFVDELAAREIPVVPASRIGGATLHHHGGFAGPLKAKPHDRNRRHTHQGDRAGERGHGQ